MQIVPFLCHILLSFVTFLALMNFSSLSHKQHDFRKRKLIDHKIYLGFVSPCIIIYSNKSTNPMHQSPRFIACRLNTAQQVLGILMPETCWAVFKRQAINLRDWCIWLVDLFEYKNVFWFFLLLLFETFLILIKIQRGVIIYLRGSSSAVSVTLSDFN
jgi:hypothetical protein